MRPTPRVDGRGLDVRDGRGRRVRRLPAGVEARRRVLARHLGGEPGTRRRAVHRLEDETLTFEEHFRAAAHLATILVDGYGIEKGDRVAIVMRNFPEWSIAFWAAAAVGAIVVPLNVWWTADELEYGLRDSGSKVVFVDVERLDRLAEVLPGLDVAVVAACADERVSAGAERWEDVLGAVPADATLPAVDLEPEDLATIFYTSGTTGRPKGALGTHRNICGNLLSLGFAGRRAQMRAGKEPAATSGQNVYLLSVPFFHATGCHSILVANLAAGGKLVLMHKWDAERGTGVDRTGARHDLRRSSRDGVAGVAIALVRVARHLERSVDRVRRAPAAPELVRRIDQLFPGRTPSNGYGLTETSSVTTMNSGVDYQRKPESVGVPVPVVDLRGRRHGGERRRRGRGR